MITLNIAQYISNKEFMPQDNRSQERKIPKAWGNTMPLPGFSIRGQFILLVIRSFQNLDCI